MKAKNPMAYAKALVAKDYGPVTVVRAVTQHYPKLQRKEVLRIAGELGLNLGTAARQYQEVRSGKVRLTGVQ